MVIWDWQIFWNDLTLSAVVASAISTGLVMLAMWALKKKRQIVFWMALWVSAFAAIQVGAFLMQLNPAVDSARPYFTKSKSKILSFSNDAIRGTLEMTIVASVKNNDRPASNYISQIMILDTRLDPTVAPLKTGRIRNANDVGRFQTLNHRARVKVDGIVQSSYIVHEIKYSDALSGEIYPQIWFMKMVWSLRGGKLSSSLFEARYDERTKMEEYIEQRKIPTLATRSGAT